MNDPLGLVGRTLAGKYRVDRVLGEGGFGVVYAGTHLVASSPVAIKCLRPGPSTAGTMGNEWLREVRALFGLSHPAIVRLYDADTIDTPYGRAPMVVLELVDGEGLDHAIRSRRAQRRPFTRDEILAIFRPVLAGLAHAHARGVVHGDLKPSNIMLSSTGPKILDFGSARGDTEATTMGNVAGFTPRYGAPEQWDPSIGSRSARTDVFSIALTIEEACTLEFAIPGETPQQILAAALSASRPVLVGDRRPDLAALVPVLARATRKDPAARHANAAELAEDLERAFLAPRSSAPPIDRVSGPGPSRRPSVEPPPALVKAPFAILVAVIAAGLLLALGLVGVRKIRGIGITAPEDPAPVIAVRPPPSSLFAREAGAPDASPSASASAVPPR